MTKKATTTTISDDPDPLDLIIQGVLHILPWLMTIAGTTILTLYLYGDLT